MSDINDPASWMDYAEADLAAARSALRRRKPSTSIACFHAQQCAEKYVKALLVEKRQPFPKTHDLIALSDLCARSGVILAVDGRLLNILADHAVRSRYPGDEPTLADAKEALKIAQMVRRLARNLLGLAR